MKFEGQPQQAEHPETIYSTPEREAIHDTVEEIEDKFEGLSWDAKLLMRWLRRYHKIEVEIRELTDGRFSISIESLPEAVPSLPVGYGYKGGAARVILEHVLNLPETSPRDLDLVYLGDSLAEDHDISSQLAEAYMPDDYTHGYGVESLEENYFDSRDFTLNEVLYDGQDIVFTKACLIDVMRNIIRFSDYEKEESYRGDDFFIKPKLMAKALRLVSDARVKGKERARLADETEGLQEIYIDEFHISLHLDRAIEQGLEVAQGYVDELVGRGFLPKDIYTVREAYDYLVYQTDFVFRSATTMEMQRELDFLEDEYEKDTFTSVVPFWRKT